MFLKIFSQIFNNITVNIFEEIVLLDIIDSDIIGIISEFCRLRIISALEMINSLLQKSDNNVNRDDFIFTDYCKYKSEIYSLLNSLFF